MLANFMPYFTPFSVRHNFKITFFLFSKKKWLFFNFHTIQPISTTHQLERFCSSVRRRKIAGEVRDDMSTSTHYGYPNLTQFKRTDLGTRLSLSICSWWGWWIRIFSLKIWYKIFVCSEHSRAIQKDWRVSIACL